MMEQPDEKHWCPIETKDGHIYYDADITASARVRRIVIRAQANQTELGYWRDVATGLATLVDELELKLQGQSIREVGTIWCPNCDTEIKLP